MEEEDKLPLKRVELSLSKFNEVAIPHHLDLLRQHRVNIMKHAGGGELARVRGEQAGARRAAAQLRALLAELAALRRRVRAEDRARFDALTRRSRDRTLAAVVDYLECAPAEARAEAGSVTSTESVGVVAHAAADELLQLQVDERELALREREAVLRGWGELQAEVRALHEAWQCVQAAALAQREPLQAAAARAGDAAAGVAAARADLALAERYLGGRFVGRRRQAQLQEAPASPQESDKDR